VEALERALAEGGLTHADTLTPGGGRSDSIVLRPLAEALQALDDGAALCDDHIDLQASAKVGQGPSAWAPGKLDRPEGGLPACLQVILELRTAVKRTDWGAVARVVDESRRLRLVPLAMFEVQRLELAMRFHRTVGRLKDALTRFPPTPVQCPNPAPPDDPARAFEKLVSAPPWPRQAPPPP
jgi:hypothetical protein